TDVHHVPAGPVALLAQHAPHRSGAVLRPVLHFVDVRPVPDVRARRHIRPGRIPQPQHQAGTSKNNSIQATAADGSKESIRSLSPPWPGTMLPMSLMPRWRLISDSIRSLTVALQASAAPNSKPCHHWPPSSRSTESTPASMPNTSDPAKPSQDFFGLIRGAIGCLPNSTPQA